MRQPDTLLADCFAPNARSMAERAWRFALLFMWVFLLAIASAAHAAPDQPLKAQDFKMAGDANATRIARALGGTVPVRGLFGQLTDLE